MQLFLTIGKYEQVFELPIKVNIFNFKLPSTEEIYRSFGEIWSSNVIPLEGETFPGNGA